MITPLDALEQWERDGTFKAGEHLTSPTDAYLQHRADCVEQAAQALHHVVRTNPNTPYVNAEHLPVPYAERLVHLFPTMSEAVHGVPRTIVTLKNPSGLRLSSRSVRFAPRGRYGLNAVVLDSQVADGQGRAQLALHLSARTFVPYIDTGRKSADGEGISHLWVTITTDGVMRVERITVVIDPVLLLEASLGWRPKTDALTISRHVLSDEESYDERIWGLTSDLASLAGYLREVATALPGK